MERTVISVYNSGALTKELLMSILEPYRGTDIDHGGSENLVTQDGKSADDVILSILAPEKYKSLCEEKAKLDRDGITGESLWGLGEIRNGAKRHQLYGGAEVIRDRRTHRGFRTTRTPEWENGQNRMWDYDERYMDALDAVTGWN